MENQKPYLIIFLGAPGSGKGTQSTLVAETFRFLRIEMSKLLEERFKKAQPGEYVEIDGTKYSFKEQEERSRRGLLVETPVVVQTVWQKIEELYEAKKGVVLDGFPRSIEQMESVISSVLKMYGKEHLLVIYIDISEEQGTFRNVHRRTCELMRHPVLYSEETKALSRCPLDGSKLVTRVDDPEIIIKTRFEQFRKETLPLLDYFEGKEVQVYTIQGDQPVAEVFEDTKNALVKAMKDES